MYKKAIGRKRTGAVAGAAVIFVIFIVIFALGGTAARVAAALVCGSFITLIVFSIKQYNERISDFEAGYGGDLEEDVNSCNVQVADKYFFLRECIADLANAKLIYYDDIKNVEGEKTSVHRSGSSNSLGQGFILNIHMLDGSTNVIADFESNASNSLFEKRKNYQDFITKLSALRPDIDIADREL